MKSKPINRLTRISDDILVDQIELLLGFEEEMSFTDREQSLWLNIFVALSDERSYSSARVDVLQRWFSAGSVAVDSKIERIRDILVSAEIGIYDLGRLFERHLARLRSGNRKDQGAYYTPLPLAKRLLQEAVGPSVNNAMTVAHLLNLKICDPAAGAGAFALPLLDILAARLVELSEELDVASARSLALQHCIYLVDVDPLAVSILRSILWLHSGCSADLQPILERRVVCGDSICGPLAKLPGSHSGFDWYSTFPKVFAAGGFDSIIGNPPWGGLRPDSLRTKLDDGREWDSYSADRRAYAKSLQKYSGYAFQGKGDADLYRYFVERSMQLVRSGGTLGVIVPAVFLKAEGAKPLRQEMNRRGGFRSILEYWNSRRLFDIHSMFRFILLTWQESSKEGIEALSLRNHDPVLEPNIGVRLDSSYLREVSGDRLTVPDVRTDDEAILLSHISRQHPFLGERDKGLWNVRFVREVDMTGAGKKFINIADALHERATPRADGTWKHPELGTLLPVYEGRMVNQHDAFAKTFVRGSGRSAEWAVALPTEKSVFPQFLVPDNSSYANALPRTPRAGFCDITGHANERTVLAAIIPAFSVAGNKVPTLRFDSDDQDLHYLWVAVANSFVIDWVARRRVGTSMNFFQWDQIPFPRIDPKSDVGCALIGHAKSLTRWTAQTDIEELGRRAEIRARIDALVAVQFGLTLRDLSMILSDFPLLDRNSAAHPGTQTRDLVLLELGYLLGISKPTLADAEIPPDCGSRYFDERVAHGAARGETAYIPAEMRRVLFPVRYVSTRVS
ncbi:Eco57I restriction-modification methylase domain-containing protein [Arthrobacter sp. StoSoilB22]|uniref:Eco57I restriction-modification methylase domain-containing protein n=1 Tax=Arthrobacter sp. StoSoilB22 TaxID=2830996 RepID=UPI001CC490AE|nr:Eco57I restriction-modification methylase domain-containing protein [Arthrobacter sp. StoSoilB22]